MLWGTRRGWGGSWDCSSRRARREHRPDGATGLPEGPQLRVLIRALALLVGWPVSATVAVVVDPIAALRCEAEPEEGEGVVAIQLALCLLVVSVVGERIADIADQV